MRLSIYIVCISTLLILTPGHLKAERFNTGEVINVNGKAGELAEDEGYLFLSLHTLVDVSKFTLNRVGLGTHIKFTDIKEGKNHALLKVKAGDYYWKYINIYFGRGTLRSKLDKDDYTFSVKPGVINYPGSWSFSAEWVGNARASLDFDNYNRLSYEIEYFNRHFKQFSGKFPFEYRGQVEDPYASYLIESTKLITGRDLPNLYYQDESENESSLTIVTKDTSVNSELKAYPSLEAYVNYNTQYINSISPKGDYMLFNSNHNDVIRVGLVDVNTYQAYLLYQQKLPKNTDVSTLEWIDEDTFFLTLTNSNINRSYVAHLAVNKQDNTISAQYIKFRNDGFLIDGLPDEENQLFFFAETKFGLRGNNDIYKIDVSNEKSMGESFRKIYPKTKKLKNVIDWLVDKNGEFRAVITADYGDKEEGTEYEYWFFSNTDKKWKKIKTTTGIEQLYWLQALSEDESYYYVLTNEFGDKRSIHKYSTIDGSYQGIFFEDPEQDIIGLKIDQKNHKVIGYTVVENGLYQVKYFNLVDHAVADLSQVDSGLQLYEVQAIEHKQRLLMFGASPTSKGAWFMLNTETGIVDKVFDHSPEYEVLPKGIHHVIKTKSEDGVELEGYLVLPDKVSTQKMPLVVIPHGGPIGVRDYANNDEMQHFFASQGIATLKVNYRGSSGFGKAFENLGKKQWGEKIEQDIHTVTQFVVNNHPINSSQICAMGGSYGGYSSLMLVYLYPEVYRCAVSMAGVMDLPLMFTSRDLSRNKNFFSQLAEVVGDPQTNLNALIKKSPLYLSDEIERPYLLFQGMKDSRVRVEHALRMQQMIQLNGQENEVVIFEDEGHSFNHANSVIFYLAKSLDFIKTSFSREQQGIKTEQ